MRLTERVYLVGSGDFGFSMSNEFDCHVYLLDGGEELALVDAGVGLEPERILDNIITDRLDPGKIKYILLTHAHADHCGGAAVLKDRLGARVALHTEEVAFLEDGDEENTGLKVARADGWYTRDYRLEPCPVDIKIQDGQQITIGDLSVQTIHFPGHSRGSVCYVVSIGRSKCIFSGDTVFQNGEIALLNCVGSSLEQYRLNVGKLAHLDIDVLLPGHLLFALNKGQRHLDMAIENLKALAPPKNIL